MRRSEEAGTQVKGSGWTPRVYVLAAGILAFWPDPAAGQAVKSVQGAKVTIVGGTNAGMRVGMTGTLCRKEQAGGRVADYCPVAFEVVAVTAGSATVVVTKGQASELTTEFRAKFRQPLVPAREEVAAAEPPRPRPTVPPRPSPTPSAESLLAGSGFRWIRIPSGSFSMGCTEGDAECDSGEKPAHRVTLTRPYYVAETETTVEQYGAYARGTGTSRPSSPGFAQGKGHPVVNVSWTEAEGFCRWAGGRLPTEAEWENAARGGRDGNKYPWGNSISHDDANYLGTGGRDAWEKTSPVKGFSANGFGLYDMAGNVWEWVWDWREGSYYGRSPSTDPRGPEAGQGRVLRGGSWINYPRDLRVSNRIWNSPDYRLGNIGFRCARDANP